MARRPTIKDIAKAAGVSVATVNRVLAGTPGVREETGRKVSEAAHRIGYHATALIEKRLQTNLPELTLGFVLHKQAQAFYTAFAEQIERAAREHDGVRCKPRMVFSASQSPGEVAELIESLAGEVNAVAATAVNHPRITEAVRKLKADGIPVFALLSDFAQGERATYIGLNNIKVGRGAAAMLSITARRPGKIAIFVGGHRWHGHDLREAGFRSYFRETPPGFTVLDTLVNLETRQLTYEATLDLLGRHPDIAGIYVAGGGMEGAIAALREERAPRDVALAVNELTPESSAGLSDGYVTLVIATPLEKLCRDLIALMCEESLSGQLRGPGQHFLDPALYLPEFL